MKNSYKCRGCKTRFPREIMYSFKDGFLCKSCYINIVEKERLYNYAKALFSVSRLPPSFFRERETLRQQYGYSDPTLECSLRYLYETAKKSLPSCPTLKEITPELVEKACEEGAVVPWITM